MAVDNATQSTKRDFHLSREEKKFFEAHGYLGPFPLLGTDSVDAYSDLVLGKKTQHPCLARFYKSARRRNFDRAYVLAQRVYHRLTGKNGPLGTPTLWYKNTHLLIQEVAAPGLQPEILQRLQGILGEDLLLWGAEIIVKQGTSHRWHVDVEHTVWEGTTAWLGLANVGADNTMKIIPGSHRFGASPQELATRHGVTIENDEQLLSLARRVQPDAQIVTMDLRPGDFFIFAGSSWHASHDVSPKRRTAIIYQYCKPSARVRIPQNYDPPDPKFYPAQPPVMLASGQDNFRINHLRSIE